MIEQPNTETPVETTSAVAPELSAPVARSRARNPLRRQREAHEPAHKHFLHVLPAPVWYVAFGLAALGAFSANPVLTPLAVLMVPAMASLLWLEGEPPALLFASLLQWLEASVAIFYTDFYGISLETAGGGAAMVMATKLSLIGVCVQALGIRLALLWRPASISADAEREVNELNPVKLFWLYFVSSAGFYFVRRIAWIVPSLMQPLLATATLHWVIVFLLAYSVMRQRRHYGLLGVVFALEFVTGLLGYFASFKSIFYVMLVVIATARYVFRGVRLVQLVIIAAMLLVFCVVWSVIKMEYRDFLNQGTGQQAVLVPVSERVDKLEQLVGGLNRQSFDEGLEIMILRVSYVSYFAMCLVNVPENVPYENGALWGGAIKHVLMPRFLFPDKEAIEDSLRTQYYTGIAVAGAEEGTSIGIGYMAESYIDFGPVGMFAPILLLGMFYGGIYRYFVGVRRFRVLGFGIATAVLVFGASSVATSNIKLVGGNLMCLIVMGLFTRFLGDGFWKFATNKPGRPVSRYWARRNRKKTEAVEAGKTDESGE